MVWKEVKFELLNLLQRNNFRLQSYSGEFFWEECSNNHSIVVLNCVVQNFASLMSNNCVVINFFVYRIEPLRSSLLFSTSIQKKIQWILGFGTGEGALANKEAKKWSARTSFAASDGWKASQNTYSFLSLHKFELGKQSPPMLVSTLQHDVLETLNPTQEKVIYM